MLIVESLVDGKRMPAYSRDKVMSLGDIAMYTDAEDVPLADVLESLKNVEEGNKVDVEALKDSAALREFFAKVLPNYDRERVHDSDIRKLIQWYNILISAGITQFKAEEKEEEKTQEEPEAEK